MMLASAVISGTTGFPNGFTSCASAQVHKADTANKVLNNFISLKLFVQVKHPFHHFPFLVARVALFAILKDGHEVFPLLLAG